MEKDSLFDILSLINQLYHFKSTIPEGLKLNKIYFLENEAPDLLTKDIEHLQKSIDLYNKLVKINHILIYDNIIEEEQVVKRLAIEMELKSTNEIINELFM